MSRLTVVTHYAIDDPEYNRDYISTDLVDGHGNLLATFGDECNDKGDQKSEGFIECLRIYNPDMTIQYKKIADCDHFYYRNQKVEIIREIECQE